MPVRCALPASASVPALGSALASLTQKWDLSAEARPLLPRLLLIMVFSWSIGKQRRIEGGALPFGGELQTC